MESLHELLADARGELPPNPLDLDEISARGRKIIRRRRWSVGAAAVAVTLAAASLFPFVRPSHPDPAASPVPGLVTSLQGFTSGDYQVEASIMVTPAYEVAPIVQRPARVVGSVEVYRPGAFDPRVFRTGTPITIGSTPGFLHVATSTIRYGPNGNQKLAEIKRAAVAWPYADDAWAVLRSADDGPDDGLSAETLQQLAAQFTLGPPAPVRLPFRIGYLPPGLTLQAAGRTSLDAVRDTTLGRLGEATLAQPRPFTGLTGTVTPSGVTIIEQHQAEGVRRGATACDSYGCYRGLPGTDLYLGVTGKLPTTELRQILDGVTAANPSDRTTWFPAQS
ncbi:hypothetical protein [Actinoplanes sp. NPDC051411]|uniref:hypothetical protein n=1 Tax=Actinoplanes sp. NPDC051411 TaxID=3155522 RepID=UPI0034177078